MQGITFTKSPFLEAVCIFEFTGGKEWDWTIPGRFFARIEDDYAVDKRKAEEDSDEPVESGESGLLRFLSKDKKHVIHIGPDGMSVNRLRPYGGWLEYKAEIERILDCYWQTAEPELVKSLTLHYVNRFHLPEGLWHYDKFLNVAPMLPPGKRDMGWINWGQRVELWCDDLEAIFSIKAGTAKFRRKDAEEPQQIIMLELQIKHGLEEPLQRQSVSDWLEGAHSEIRKTFLDSLTDLSKETMGYEEVNNES